MADVSFSLYDANKSLMSNEATLTKTEIKDAIKESIIPLIQNSSNRYFMMLCREQYDFTLFNFYNKDDNTLETTIQDFYECFTNRGKVISINEADDNAAIEVWLKIDGECFCYHIFPYDLGVLEEGV